MFAAGDFVFYGSGGICRIADVLPAPLEHMPAGRMYYVMHSIHDSNGVIYVPVDSDQVFLRSLITKEEAELLLRQIPAILPIEESNAKLLREKYLLAMKQHTPVEWIRVVKTIRRRREVLAGRAQRLSETERSFGENAMRFLRTELSLALGLSEEELAPYVERTVGISAV